MGPRPIAAFVYTGSSTLGCVLRTALLHMLMFLIAGLAGYIDLDDDLRANEPF